MISEKLKAKEKVGYALGDMGCAFAMTTINTYLMYFYTDVFGINVAAVGTLFLIARIWDAINDPIIGNLIDKSNFKKGKYKTFIFYGSIPLALFSVLCFTAPDLSNTMKLVYAYVTYIGAGMLYTLVNTSYSSLSSLITEDPDERTNLTAVRMYLANIGNMCLSVGVPVLAVMFGKKSAGTGYRITAMVFAGLSIILFLTTYFTTTERIKVVNTEEKAGLKEMVSVLLKNKPLIILCIVFIVAFTNVSISTAIGTYYIKYNMGREDLTSIFILFTSLPGLISLALIPHFSKKIGKKKLLAASYIISIIGLFGMYIAPESSVTAVFVFRFISGFGATLIMGLIWNMAPDVIDYGEYVSGRRLSAITYAIIGFFFKLGNALAGIIPSIIMDRTGYQANMSQTASALFGIKFSLIGVPLILSILVLIPIFAYKLDGRESQKIAQVLHERRELLEEGANS